MPDRATPSIFLYAAITLALWLAITAATGHFLLEDLLAAALTAGLIFCIGRYLRRPAAERRGFTREVVDALRQIWERPGRRLVLIGTLLILVPPTTIRALYMAAGRLPMPARLQALHAVARLFRYIEIPMMIVMGGGVLLILGVGARGLGNWSVRGTPDDSR